MLRYLLQREYATQYFVWGTLKRLENDVWVDVCKTIEPPLPPRKNDGKLYHALPEGKYKVDMSYEDTSLKNRPMVCVKDHPYRVFISQGHNFRTCAGNINVGKALTNGALGVLVDTKATCEKITREVRDALMDNQYVQLRICDIKWRV